MRKEKTYITAPCGICRSLATRHELIASKGSQYAYVQCQECLYRKIIDHPAGVK